MTARIIGPNSVKRGGRANFTYRISNNAAAPIGGVVVTNTLPSGLSIDATSRRANLRVKKKSLRFTGAGRKVTFRLATIGAGKTVVVRVNAKVAVKAATGKRRNVLGVFRGKGIPVTIATSRVTIK